MIPCLEQWIVTFLTLRDWCSSLRVCKEWNLLLQTTHAAWVEDRVLLSRVPDHLLSKVHHLLCQNPNRRSFGGSRVGFCCPSYDERPVYRSGIHSLPPNIQSAIFVDCLLYCKFPPTLTSVALLNTSWNPIRCGGRNGMVELEYDPAFVLPDTIRSLTMTSTPIVPLFPPFLQQLTIVPHVDGFGVKRRLRTPIGTLPESLVELDLGQDASTVRFPPNVEILTLHDSVIFCNELPQRLQTLILTSKRGPVAIRGDLPPTLRQLDVRKASCLHIRESTRELSLTMLKMKTYAYGCCQWKMPSSLQQLHFTRREGTENFLQPIFSFNETQSFRCLVELYIDFWLPWIAELPVLQRLQCRFAHGICANILPKSLQHLWIQEIQGNVHDLPPSITHVYLIHPVWWLGEILSQKYPTLRIQIVHNGFA